MLLHSTPAGGKKKRNMFQFLQVVLPSKSMKYFSPTDLKEVKLISIEQSFTCTHKKNSTRRGNQPIPNTIATQKLWRKQGEPSSLEREILIIQSQTGI